MRRAGDERYIICFYRFNYLIDDQTYVWMRTITMLTSRPSLADDFGRGIRKCPVVLDICVVR